MALLDVADLSVRYPTDDGIVQAVHDLSFALDRNETLGIVGESGSGKTQTALSVMGLLPDAAQVSGHAVFDGIDTLALDEAALNRIRGNDLAMIFQDPMTSLNPHLKIGRQMARVLQRHRGVSKRAAYDEAARMLDAVRIPAARSRLDQYPHEMSGGMRQRVMIATALLCQPRLLIADEPTTALDVTVQAQILELMNELQTEFHTAILLITHDMGVVAGTCDRVLVMRDGVAQETGTADAVFASPTSDYTRHLLAAVPRLDRPGNRKLTVGSDPILRAEGVRVSFDVDDGRLFGRAPQLQAVDDVSLELRPGETLGVVGESGCGKSTLARAILQLVTMESGRVCLLGDDLGALSPQALTAKRRDMQIIFQDPLASLDPRMTVGDIVAEPLLTFFPQLTRAEREQEVQGMLRKVGLKAEYVHRYPHEFSGGQCQRIGIARALISKPDLIICDEPVSALDVSVQAQIIDLLMELQQERDLALIFIAHDLAVVRQISHRVMVMYLGRAVEVSDGDALYEAPRHPYTQALISAVPVPDPEVERGRERTLLKGDVPSPVNPPSGCAFRTRCPLADQRCADERPRLRPVGDSAVACHYAEMASSAC